MSNSLRAKLSKLRYKGEITQEEYSELIKKLDGHDKQIWNDAIDECIKTLAKDEDTILTDEQYYTLKQLKGEEE